LFPVKVLARVFRGKFVAGLKRAFRRGKLLFPGSLKAISTDKAFRTFLRPLFRQDWVVYAKPPFGGPERLQYLARYTHRVAISNHRLLNVADGQVTFRWKDYAHANKQRKMTVSGEEFLCRFLLHVLPKGFIASASFGFLAPRRRAQLLPLCQQFLAHPPSPTPAVSQPPVSWHCPRCGGTMKRIENSPLSRSHPGWLLAGVSLIPRNPLLLTNSKRAPARAIAVCLAGENSPIEPTLGGRCHRNPLARTSKVPVAIAHLFPATHSFRDKTFQNSIQNT
jgi:hypothetical protein